MHPKPPPLSQVWDLIVVGAGVAGAAFAFQAGRDGRRVLLLERDLSQPDRIIGELLQPGGYLKLKELGLAGAVDGINAQKVGGPRAHRRGSRGWGGLLCRAVSDGGGGVGPGTSGLVAVPRRFCCH